MLEEVSTDKIGVTGNLVSLKFIDLSKFPMKLGANSLIS